MLIIGELINTSRKTIAPAVESYDVRFIQELASKQVEAGADYIDVNCGTMVFSEPDTIAWLVEAIQNKVSAPLCIDSPNPEAIERALSLIKNRQSMINSITGEEERFKKIIPLVQKYRTKIVALCMDDSGMPETAEERLKIADKLVVNLKEAGVVEDDIYLDPLVKPLSTDDEAGMQVLKTIKGIKSKYPEVHCICGLSNVSYGLPSRKTINQVFMVQTMTMGMDAYILDPMDKSLMGFVYASKALLGKDPYCSDYLTAYRKGGL